MMDIEFIHLFILSKCLLSIYYTPGTVLGMAVQQQKKKKKTQYSILSKIILEEMRDTEIKLNT